LVIQKIKGIPLVKFWALESQEYLFFQFNNHSNLRLKIFSKNPYMDKVEQLKNYMREAKYEIKGSR
jgi:hypothetical protein